MKKKKARLRLCGHVMRTDGESDARKTLEVEAQGRIRAGRPKTRQKNSTAADMKEKQLHHMRGLKPLETTHQKQPPCIKIG